MYGHNLVLCLKSYFNLCGLVVNNNMHACTIRKVSAHRAVNIAKLIVWRSFAVI